MGLRGVIPFTLDDARAMDGAVARAVSRGAVVAKAPYQTHFGQLMALLRDPEGNAFAWTPICRHDPLYAAAYRDLDSRDRS